MARQYEGDVKRGDMPLAAPSALVVVPSDNSRWEWQGRTLEDILAHPPQSVEDMVESLVREGQKQAICVHPVAGNALKVHAGFNRAVAAMLIVSRGINPLFRVKCSLEDINEKEAFRASVIENKQRQDTTQLDDAYAVRRLTAYGYTDAEILTIYGRSASWLNSLRKLLRLPDEQKLAIHNRQLSARAGVWLSEMDPQLADIVLKEAKEEAGGKPITQDHVLKAARKNKALRTTHARRVKEIREFWEERARPGNPPRIVRLAKYELMFQAGEIDADQFYQELTRL